ncbi:MAG: adenylate kinase [Tenericutes bacterium]|nr:adenylate kinase [Mycoplasmatota bacterium]
MKNIMFIAPPAAGKGTQAELVVAKYNLPHISTGEILREISKEDSELGHYVAETLASGNLVKDEITYQLIEERLKKEDCQNGFIIDGFPRTLDQAIEYDKILAKLNYDVGNVILINIDAKTLEKRVTGRRICENCKTIFNINIESQAPEVESVCDACGGKLYQRSDDNLESFQNRYKTYQEKTEPIIEHYRKQNVLHEVNGDDTVENVFAEIDKIISE